jgi:CRISPR-associated protein Csd1
LQERPPVRRLSIPIMHLPGGKRTGIALIAMQEPAFMSYGLEYSLNAPICADCEQRCGTALNALLRDPDTHTVIDDRVYLFWPRDYPPLPVDQLLGEGNTPGARRAFMAPRLGEREAVASDAWDTTSYYTAVVKANAARFVLLQWNEQPFGQVIRHLKRYFEMGSIAVIDRETGVVRDIVLPVWQLRDATVRTAGDTRERAYPIVKQSLLRLALEGQPLPLRIAQLVIARVLAERSVRPAHAALLQLYLLSQRDAKLPSGGGARSRTNSQHGVQEGSSTEEQQFPEEERDPIAARIGLDLEATDVAYLTGRAFVLLEEIQYTAHRRAVGNSLRERFLALAAKQPQLAWVALLREAGPLLSKITRRNQAAGTYFERRLGEVLAPVSEYPKTFTSAEQARFLLATYQQRHYYMLRGLQFRARG